MKRIGGLFAPIHGQPPLELVDGEFLQGALGGRGRPEHDHLGSRSDIDSGDPDDAADGPHFDDDFALIGALLGHGAPATRCHEIMGRRGFRCNRPGELRP